MNYVGVDLHKKIITACVMDANRKIVARRSCIPTTHGIVEFFGRWAVQGRRRGDGELLLVRRAAWSRSAAEIVLANPKKLRVIAESTRKTDKLDAQVLAEFLARDMIPRAYMPTPRQRQHRALVRHRESAGPGDGREVQDPQRADRLQRRSPRSVLRRARQAYRQAGLNDADRFVVRHCGRSLEHSRSG